MIKKSSESTQNLPKDEYGRISFSKIPDRDGGAQPSRRAIGEYAHFLQAAADPEKRKKNQASNPYS